MVVFPLLSNFSRFVSFPKNQYFRYNIVFHAVVCYCTRERYNDTIGRHINALHSDMQNIECSKIKPILESAQLNCK